MTECGPGRCHPGGWLLCQALPCSLRRELGWPLRSRGAAKSPQGRSGGAPTPACPDFLCLTPGPFWRAASPHGNVCISSAALTAVPLNPRTPEPLFPQCPVCGPHRAWAIPAREVGSGCWGAAEAEPLSHCTQRLQALPAQLQSPAQLWNAGGEGSPQLWLPLSSQQDPWHPCPRPWTLAGATTPPCITYTPQVGAGPSSWGAAGRTRAQLLWGHHQEQAAGSFSRAPESNSEASRTRGRAWGTSGHHTQHILPPLGICPEPEALREGGSWQLSF